MEIVSLLYSFHYFTLFTPSLFSLFSSSFHSYSFLLPLLLLALFTLRSFHSCSFHSFALFTPSLFSLLRSFHSFALFTPSLFSLLRSFHSFALFTPSLFSLRSFHHFVLFTPSLFSLLRSFHHFAHFAPFTTSPLRSFHSFTTSLFSLLHHFAPFFHHIHKNMNNELFKKFIPHLVAFVVLLVVTLAYFYPTLEGKVVQQSDIINYQGMSQEIKSYREKTGESTLWTNSMFGGMPAYQIEMPPNNNPLNMVRTGMLNFIPRTAAMILWAMVGFYVLMLVLGASPWVAMVGALGFGFSTYNVLIIDAGHVTKMLAMSTMPAVLAGVVLTYRRNLLAGAALTGFAFASNILSNHYQITYYLLMMLGIYVLAELVDAVRSKRLAHFAKASVILALVFALGIGTDLSRILTTAEYSKETTRGGSALGNDSQSGEKGLGRDYAFAWSSGVLETMTLIVPRFMGGSSNELLSENSEAKQLIRQDRGPTYWGAMPFTGGPVYFGAIICFLFILGCFVVKGPTKWWIIAATLVSIMLSWGKNFPMLNNLLFDYLPGYNKFRTVSMILVIAQLTMPLMGVWHCTKLLAKK
ncbi:MAG: hypothetical protein IPN94_00760 [Sphingobacteriales bacterium]|nr:hypothetical protein [Sphingobacteriales bacterium]